MSVPVTEAQRLARLGCVWWMALGFLAPVIVAVIGIAIVLMAMVVPIYLVGTGVFKIINAVK